MDSFIDVCIVRQKPFGVLPAFTLFTGEVGLLRDMLPDSEFVASLESVVSVQGASVRSVTQFKIELASLNEESLSRDRLPRSPLHAKYGTTSARDLRDRLIQEIDSTFVTRMEAMPF